MHPYVKLVVTVLAVLAVVTVVADTTRLQGTSAYAITGAGQGRAYILDTRTGIVRCCSPMECWELEEGTGPFTETEE